MSNSTQGSWTVLLTKRLGLLLNQGNYDRFEGLEIFAMQAIQEKFTYQN